MEKIALGKMLRDLRKANNKTQQEIADYLDCWRSHYAKIESGERALPLWIADKLADYYGISVDNLIDRTNNKNTHENSPGIRDFLKERESSSVRSEQEALMEKTELGKKLQDLRKANAKTQQEIADNIGYTRSGYARIERGERALPLRIADKLADYYGISVDNLIDRTNNKNTHEKSQSVREFVKDREPFIATGEQKENFKS